ncbi:hypothetical protein NECAME_05617 [Necator americanus]|uniref:Uncharacterized protein n=1 Tax=Necator americanus TaxID=51031 RepID=W2SFN9_NECAM|nr:hypothetical protein NECAME_05617 [Necator americanus]ETN68429.1 hypothetical protein NECAME_05617 [Necator americanus]
MLVCQLHSTLATRLFAVDRSAREICCFKAVISVADLFSMQASGPECDSLRATSCLDSFLTTRSVLQKPCVSLDVRDASAAILSLFRSNSRPFHSKSLLQFKCAS